MSSYKTYLENLTPEEFLKEVEFVIEFPERYERNSINQLLEVARDYVRIAVEYDEIDTMAELDNLRAQLAAKPKNHTQNGQ